MTIANAARPNVSAPGTVSAAPLTGNEIIAVNAGTVSAIDTAANVADSALVDQTVTATGSTRATAYAIVAQVTNITTAAASTGVVLPAANKPGACRRIFNAGANPITVYGNGTDTIDTIAGATGVTLTNAKRCEYYCVAVGVWISAQLGAVSA